MKRFGFLLSLLTLTALASTVIPPPGSGSGSGNPSWEQEGNAGLDAAVNFIGTQDDVDVVMKAFDTEVLRLVSGQAQVTVTGSVVASGLLSTDDLLRLNSGAESVSLEAPASFTTTGYSLVLPEGLPGVTRPLVSSSAGALSFASTLSLDSLSLPNDGPIIWRNAADSADLELKVNASDELESDAPILLPGLPTAANHAATKAYVDATANQIKPNIVAATTGSGTLATDYENGDTLDGVVLATGDRILIKDQVAEEENGVYVVAASGAPTRATDSDTWDELVNAYAFIEGGTINQYSGWRSNISPGGTLETTAIPFALFSQAGDFTADGEGIELTGAEFSIELDGGTLTKSASGLAVDTGALDVFTGDSGAGGAVGIVPAPAAGDAASEKFLHADGTWKTPDLANGVVTVDRFSGDGSEVAFTLSQDPGDENNTLVYVAGVYQQKDTYSVSGTTLTFSTAPPSGTDNIEVHQTSTIDLGTYSLTDESVTDQKLRDSAALSVIGRSANSSGDPGDIVAGTDGHVLRRSGTTLGFGQVPTAGIQDAAITAAKLASGAITAGALPSTNYSESSSSGSYSTSSASFVDITNLSVTITASGNRPVLVQMLPAGTAGNESVSTATSGIIRFLVGGSTFNATFRGGTGSASHVIPCSSYSYMHRPSAGSQTYKAQAMANSGTVAVTGCKLVAYEL